MEAYARALRQLPTIIADNGGYDGSDLISSLRAAHAQGAKASTAVSRLVRLRRWWLLVGRAGCERRCCASTVLLQFQSCRMRRFVNNVKKS